MKSHNIRTLLPLIILHLCFFSNTIIGQMNSGFAENETAEIYSGKQLKYIGMPVGGINCGQVYLGGDGQLWYWDIFNIQGINPGGPGDKFYLNPIPQERKFEQGFAVRLKRKPPPNITPTAKILREGGFRNISFKGEYPIGKVKYEDPDFPVSVMLNSFTPFIPTDHESSGLPAVIMEYTLTNDSNEEVFLELIGWLQNMANFQTFDQTEGNHINQLIKKENALQLFLSSDASDKDLPDYGNMTLTLVDGQNAWGTTNTQKDIAYNLPEVRPSKDSQAKARLGKVLTGAIGEEIALKPGEQHTITFLLSWYFPNLHRKESGFHNLKNRKNLRHYYSNQFNSSAEVADQIISNKKKYIGTTKSWNKTWYDSSLPKWFLNRTFLNTSTLATASCYRLDDLKDDPDNEGRFYTMEGVYRGHGTCTHVFHYEQAVGRIFPGLARQLRTQVDYGLSFKENGIIGYRGELSGMGHHDGRGYAVDGHAGTILRAYREHTTSNDNDYLKTYWPKIKKSIEYMIAHDAEKTGTPDGILEGIQYNTLDRMWYGKIAWISGLYNAVLRAGEAMAGDIGDEPFEQQCRQLAERGYKNISSELFNGEYFFQLTDPENLDAPNTNKGCHAEQLVGQYWVHQANLPDIVPEHQVKMALKSIVKYNFQERYGNYLDTAAIKVSRYYALPDESALITCSFPKGGADKAAGKIHNEWEKLVIGYFSEPWTGQEHHVAATLISQGMVDEGLMIEKAVHQRYSPEKRNPYNEIEYGNHYTRAMSGLAPFISASGFNYHGPKGEIGFDPKINPQDFKSAFITGESWGSFSQKRMKTRQENSIEIAFGKLSLNQLTVGIVSSNIRNIILSLNGENFPIASKKETDKALIIKFDEINLKEGDVLRLWIN